MPSIWGGEYVNQSARIAAWTNHYIAKGCNSSKAERCAMKKVERSKTWPPIR